jgi:hypothetical protein
VNGACQDAADFGAALGHSSKSAHDFRYHAVDHVEAQMDHHRLSWNFPHEVTRDALYRWLHFS